MKERNKDDNEMKTNAKTAATKRSGKVLDSFTKAVKANYEALKRFSKD